MPGLVPGIHVFLRDQQDVDGWDNRAFTPVFDGLCPAMTNDKLHPSHFWIAATAFATTSLGVR